MKRKFENTIRFAAAKLIKIRRPPKEIAPPFCKNHGTHKKEICSAKQPYQAPCFILTTVGKFSHHGEKVFSPR
ncbi:MAG: hypothetical protein J6I32_03280 [Bacteroidaceae bacterium]|nr:hypothetical protein [Bacteroidaceae bacterium]